jgi:hypothetical protein
MVWRIRSRNERRSMRRASYADDTSNAELCPIQLNGESRYQASASCSGLIGNDWPDASATASQSAAAETLANSLGSIL